MIKIRIKSYEQLQDALHYTFFSDDSSWINYNDKFVILPNAFSTSHWDIETAYNCDCETYASRCSMNDLIDEFDFDDFENNIIYLMEDN